MVIGLLRPDYSITRPASKVRQWHSTRFAWSNKAVKALRVYRQGILRNHFPLGNTRDAQLL